MNLIRVKKTICQSCASPVSRDFEKGREKDGSFSEHFCRRCFNYGAFTDPQMTAEKMHEMVRARMLGLNFPKYLAMLSADTVYNLERWAVHKN